MFKTTFAKWFKNSHEASLIVIEYEYHEMVRNLAEENYRRIQELFTELVRL